MDLQKLLKDKAEYFKESNEDRGIFSVISHIEIAEKHYENGKKGDEYLFNDSIYRSNQAFEGSLKEAYRILAGKDVHDTITFKIEKYLEENKILKERVLQLFSNYRTEWRNTSTHDYTIYFSEQEAFLAIVNISAFISILLDQMIEKKAYEKEEHIIKVQNRILPNIQSSKNLPFVDYIIKYLIDYSATVPELIKGSVIPHLTESELVGSLMAYFKSINNSIDIKNDVRLNINGTKSPLFADFIFSDNNEKIIMEIKKYPAVSAFNLDKGIKQIMNYLTISGITTGILFIPPSNSAIEMDRVVVKNIVDGIEYTIYELYPKRNLTIAST